MSDVLRYEQWSQADAEREVPKRLKAALEHRRKFEGAWQANEQILFGAGATSSEVSLSFESMADLIGGDLDGGDSMLSINYAFKFLRFIHSQLAANPPSVIPRPASQDYNDRRTAEVALHLVDHARRNYDIQDKIDLTTLQVLCYGSGVLKTAQDPHAGEVLRVDQATREITMTGDIKLKPLLIWNFAFDHTAECWDDVRYTFERHCFSVEEASYKWPKHKERFEAQASKSKGFKGFWSKSGDEKSVIEVWEYTEKALPWNGMAGRRFFLLEDGTALSDLTVNPAPEGSLPYDMLTDIDVPGQVYGRTVIDYLLRLQDILNRLDSTILDNIQAHGTIRIITYDAAETNEDNLPSNSGWQILNLKGTAAQKPDYIDPPALMPDLWTFRAQLVQAIADLAGVNESMEGRQSREMSGFSMQTAIDAGNMVRKRLFNKYQKLVRCVYTRFLQLVQKHWNTKRKIMATGQEGALAVAYYEGADLSGGFDLEVDYGASFSLEPSRRREEIMQIMPMLKEAGFSMRMILGMMRFNDMPGLMDRADMSGRRQLEIFDEMIAKYEEGGVLAYVAPEELEDHQNMLPVAYDFRQSMAYKTLDAELKPLIEKHIKDREALAAQAAAAGAQPGPDAAPPPGGLPGGALAGMLPSI